MTLTKALAKDNLTRLIEKFEQELNASRIKEYNEEAAKIAFIQPFLKDVLGWDVHNHDEVSPEEKTSRGRVDYGLKIEGQIKIFVEAKPPKADLNKHIEQAVRYGYNRKGVPFVLLTDFEGLKLFDVTLKPDPRNPFKGLKIDLSCNQYIDKFDELSLLSKESVKNGELEKLLLIKPKERLPVDKAILDDLQKWREVLAKNIFKNNHNLFNSSDREKDANYLKEITQRILDRIIFMRFCEDRKFVHRPPLREFFEERTDTVGTNTMVFLKEEFKHYNIIFDSDLFRPQEWENNLLVDFKVMRDIILETYNPYQFDVIPLEVLGNIYEQYLGYAVRLTEHHVKYELKPDVRKAGGVYYTTEYIVDYIVKNTVGKLLQELPASKIKKLRILDPACGSGSFLIRAYEEMQDWYKNQKKRQPSRHHSDSASDKCHPELGSGSQRQIIQDESEPVLSIEEKANILREHIFGVDIDEQAVEVTKLSLMLKMLDGEFGIIPGRNILPMLDKNVKCGNSLISGDSFELMKYFGKDYYKVKPFNWQDEFRQIMVDEGGFDVVIGNPPYVFTRELIKENEKNYYNRSYRHTQFKINTYILFVEKGFNILKGTGMLAYIIPNNWLTLETASEFRRFILSDTFAIGIVNNRDKVFKNASVDTCILTFAKEGKKEIIIKEFEEGVFKYIAKHNPKVYLDSHNCIISYEIHKPKRALSLFDKIESHGIKLHVLAEIKNGIQAYTVGEGTPTQTEEMKKQRVYHSLEKKDNTWLKYVDGVDVGRYYLGWSKQFVKYGKNLTRPRKPELFQGERLLVRQIPAQPPYCILANYVSETLVNDNNSMIIKKYRNDYNLRYFLGILNSKLISFWFMYAFGKLQRKVFPQFKIKELSTFPIPKIDSSNPSEKKLHDDLVALVDIMLTLNKKHHTAKGSEKDQIQRQIEKTDREIDEIVYKLYGITEGERKIIEGGQV